MSHQIILRVDRFTKIVLVLIAIFLGILVFKPLVESREAKAQYPDTITVYFGDSLGIKNAIRRAGFGFNVNTDGDLRIKGSLDVHQR